MRTLLVSGAIANKPCNGGATWTRLSWVLGLQRLGYRVLFVEQLAPRACVDEAGRPAAFEASLNLRYFQAVVEQFGLAGSAALIDAEGMQSFGLELEELADLAQGAELLVNISGHLALPWLLALARRRAYVDLDPGFTQLWHANGTVGARLTGHDCYFTVGANIGRPDCRIPTGDISWNPVRQPVILEEWPVASGPAGHFSTVSSWRGPFGAVSYDGVTFGLKVHQFRQLIELPCLAGYTFELALDIHPAETKDLALLETHRWRLQDPRVVAGTPALFRAYVQAAGAEFSAAQGVYVDTNSGWFSDRTARYLASGKPALVQDTGLAAQLPTGEGVVTFRGLADAVAGAHDIVARYDQHCRAARALAEAYFESNTVLGPFLERALG